MLLTGLCDFIRVAFDSKTHFCSLGKAGCIEPFISQENFFYTPELSAFNQMKIMEEILNERKQRVGQTVTLDWALAFSR